ncbi:MAG: hypothetical protein ACYC5H_10825 [Methylovirgula sp.]
MNLDAATHRAIKFVLGAGLAFSMLGLANIAHADQLETLHHVGDGYQSVRVITKYEIHADRRTFDLFAKEPNIPTISRAVEKEIAEQTIQQICSGGRVGGGWIVRIFLPGETSPAATCRAGVSHRHKQ